jgi:uncharacterized protein YgiM (DUF1202 family)
MLSAEFYILNFTCKEEMSKMKFIPFKFFVFQVFLFMTLIWISGPVVKGQAEEHGTAGAEIKAEVLPGSEKKAESGGGKADSSAQSAAKVPDSGVSADESPNTEGEVAADGKETVSEEKTESAAAEESAPASPKTLSVRVDKANVRDDASLSAKINAQLKKGQAVTVLEVKDEWYHIQLDDGEDGWAHESLFSGEEAVAEKAISAGDSLPVRVSAGNIRQSPDLNAEILTTLEKGKTVTLLEAGEDWYHVKLPDESEGWAHKNLFKKTPPKNYPLDGIRIERAAENEEKVYFFYKGPKPPEVFITHAGSARIVCDFAETRPDRKIPQKTEVDGNMIQTVRLGLHGEDMRDARIVLDMHPDGNYELNHFFIRGELYLLIIRKTA